MVATLTKAEKERFLRAVEEDREFRYALMGLLGFREILDRVTKLEERFAKLEERQQRLEEWFKELAERQHRLEERFAKLEEKFAQLEERFIKLEERVMKLEERLERLERTLATIAHRFGIMSETAFREAIRSILEKYFGATATRWSRFDSEGFVYGYPAIVEVDVVIKDNVHILVEVKSRVDTGDVLELHRIGQLYRKVTGVEPRLAIVGGFVSPRAREAAAKLGIDVYSYLEE